MYAKMKLVIGGDGGKWSDEDDVLPSKKSTGECRDMGKLGNF
jgi:hypothetical protein